MESRLGELQNTLDAGMHHRDNVFNNIGYNLEQWTVMVRAVDGDCGARWMMWGWSGSGHGGEECWRGALWLGSCRDVRFEWYIGG